MSSSVTSSSLSDSLFDEQQIAAFHENGYAIVRGLGDDALRQEMLEATLDGLNRHVGPIEYEADLQYPGAPESRSSTGGSTVRRLLQAHSRGAVFTRWVSSRPVAGRLRQLFEEPVVMPLVHHNCIMTKQPGFSSDTGWHQDVRYWSFARPQLISLWLAMGVENLENGCLRLIPGSHQMSLTADRFDEQRFLRDDLAANQPLIDSSVLAELEAGDVLFFHGQTLHSATRNFTDRPKYSVVFTFRPESNPPKPDSRSSSLPELLLSSTL